MVSKDQALGGIIFSVCLVLAILYTVGLFYFGNPLGGWTIEFWLVAIPVFIAVIAVMFIGAWIGWTMATTPPPKPIEEIESETEEEKEAAGESKAEETEEAEKPETSKETKTKSRKGRTNP